MVKRNIVYIFCVIIAALCLISRVFAYIIQTTLNMNIGFNGYEILNVSGLGFWCVLLNIFQYIFLVLLIILICVSLLEILRDLNIVKFEITYKKLTSLFTCKICLFLMFVVSFLEILCVWFTILANGNYSLVFGAGTFVLTAVCLISLTTFIVLEKKNIFKDKKVQDTVLIEELKNERPQD